MTGGWNVEPVRNSYDATWFRWSAWNVRGQKTGTCATEVQATTAAKAALNELKGLR